MSQFRQFIQKFDIYSIPIQLNFKQNEKQKSFFGGLISLCSFVLIGITIWFQGKQLILRQNPIIVQSLREVIQAEKINIDKDNIIFMVGIQDSTSKSFVDNSVFQLSAIQQILEYTNDQSSGKQIKHLVPYPREIKICDESDIGREQLNDYFKQVNLPTYFCLNNTYNQTSIEGGFDQKSFSQLIIYVKKCQNSTIPNSVVCKSSEEIDRIMSSTKLSLYLADQLVEPLNFDKPFQDKGVNQYTHISSKFQKEIQLYYTNSYVDTDFGLILQDTVTQKGFQFSQMTEVQMNDNPSVICRVLLRIQKQKEFYMSRRYDRIFYVAAQIGGLIKIITLVCMVIARPFQRFHYHQRIVNEIFNFNTEEQVIAVSDQGMQKNRSREISLVENKSMISGFQDGFEKSYRRGGFYMKQVLKVFRVTKEAMKYRFTDYIRHFICPKTQQIEKKKPLLDYSIKKVLQNLDILYILNKLIEIEKLKYILFDEDQLKLFEFIPKPEITLSDTKNQDQSQNDQNTSVDSSLKKQIKVPKFYFEADKTMGQKANDCQQSLMSILQKVKKSVVDQKLLNSIDPTLLNYKDNIQSSQQKSISPIKSKNGEQFFSLDQSSQNIKQLDDVLQRKNKIYEKSQYIDFDDKFKCDSYHSKIKTNPIHNEQLKNIYLQKVNISITNIDESVQQEQKESKEIQELENFQTEDLSQRNIHNIKSHDIFFDRFNQIKRMNKSNDDSEIIIQNYSDQINDSNINYNIESQDKIK